MTKTHAFLLRVLTFVSSPSVGISKGKFRLSKGHPIILAIPFCIRLQMKNQCSAGTFVCNVIKAQ